MNKYLRHAIKLALANDYDEKLDYHLAAVIVKGGNIISTGFNRRTTNGFVEHYTDLIRGFSRDFALSTHAEMDAVLRGRSKTDLRGAKIYVARIKRDRTESVTGLARPCEICQTVLHAYGIKRALYTIDDNNYGVMRVVAHNITDKLIQAHQNEQL